MRLLFQTNLSYQENILIRQEKIFLEVFFALLKSLVFSFTEVSKEAAKIMKVGGSPIKTLAASAIGDAKFL